MADDPCFTITVRGIDRTGDVRVVAAATEGEWPLLHGFLLEADFEPLSVPASVNGVRSGSFIYRADRIIPEGFSVAVFMRKLFSGLTAGGN